MSTQYLCPICQTTNECALASTHGVASQCWCMQVKIPAEALAQVPPAQLNKSCICPTCASTFKKL